MAGTSLVSIRDIKEIKGIRLMDSGDIYIGAGTTFSHVTNDPDDSEADSGSGGSSRSGRRTAMVRNIGTIGGKSVMVRSVRTVHLHFFH